MTYPLVVMSLNWKEFGLLLSELPLEGSSIQAVVQHDFHCLSWQMYRPDVGRWILYTEVGTPNARMHLLSSPIAATQGMKTLKLQRFVQFCRRHVEGSLVKSAHQVPFDRMIILDLDNHGVLMHLYFRFYSGSQANIIVTDQDNIILDLLFRRPGRDEISGKPLVLPPVKEAPEKEFTIRPRTEGSFNRQIEQEYGEKSNEESLDSLTQRVIQRRDRELKRLETTVQNLAAKARENARYGTYKLYGDLLSCNSSMITPGSSSVTVDDYTTGKPCTIALDPRLSFNGNIQAYYERYQKAKGTWENSKAEYENAQAKLQAETERYKKLLEPTEDPKVMIHRLQKELSELTADKPTEKEIPGLQFTSGSFSLIVGRSAKENDELLRHFVKGYDWWMHTRDYPGGYVFIKGMKGKSVPLDVLLDAANLAVVFSKAKGQKHVDLYYTQVKYLRRAKDGPLGLVLPTQEKNFPVTVDDTRLKRVLSTGEDAHA
jgi:predicted ribosome quality control (RQC) complex YloA/Tae2 family protein